MCIAFFEWTEDRFLVCHNRDEFFSRPTTNTTWWPCGDGDGDGDGEKDSIKNNGGFEILAPRDVVSGGTWFGFEKTTGRCAFLTNIRELDSTKYTSSRGEFVLNYLKSDTSLSALEYLHREFGDSEDGLSKEYAGFNLVVFSGHDLAYFSNRYPEDQTQKGPIALSMKTPYGLSNSILQEPYAKVRTGLEIFDQVVTRTPEGIPRTTTELNYTGDHDVDRIMESLENLMQRTEYCPGDSLPRTGEPGFSEAIVKHRSSICVPSVNDYGTRTTIRFLLERHLPKTEDENSNSNNEKDDDDNVNFLEEKPATTLQSSTTSTGEKQQRRRLRCLEKNWNTETLQWETSMDLNCTIALQ